MRAELPCTLSSEIRRPGLKWVLHLLLAALGCETPVASEPRALLFVAADTIPAIARAVTSGAGETLHVMLRVTVPAVIYNAGRETLLTMKCLGVLEERNADTWARVYSTGCLDAADNGDVLLQPGESRAISIVADGFLSGVGDPVWNSQSNVGTFRLRIGAWTPVGKGSVPAFFSNPFVIQRESAPADP